MNTAKFNDLIFNILKNNYFIENNSLKTTKQQIKYISSQNYNTLIFNGL